MCLKKIELQQNLPPWEDTFRFVYVTTATQAKLPAAHLMWPALLHLGNRARFFHLNKDMPFPIAAQQAEFISDLSPGNKGHGLRPACHSFLFVVASPALPTVKFIHQKIKSQQTCFQETACLLFEF